MPPEGWTFSNGDHLPQGAILNLPAISVHLDEAWYDRPTEFNGFRFVNDKHPESIPSDTFLSFGHGSHSCPGRRLALVIIKCMVAELLTNYEYEHIAKRPPDFLIGAGMVPNMKQHMRVRRVLA
jgi:cytochrome P450